jgi:predicted transcriptional regulator
MLGREVWGWRMLAVMLVVLLAPTIPNMDSIQESWTQDDSIADAEPTDNSKQALPQNETNEEASDESTTSEDDSASADADASASFGGDEAPADQESDTSNSPDGPTPGISSNNEAPSFVLPATQMIVLTMMAIMAFALITSATVSVLASEAARLGILLALAAPLIAITQRGERGVFTRGRLLGFIEAHPGIHFSALRDALELGNGVTAHHIQVLEKEGRIITWIDGRVRRFASSGIDQHRLAELKSPVTGMQVAILQILSDSEALGIKSGELRMRLETSRQLMSYHMKQLTERKFVKSTGKGRAVRWNLLEAGKEQLNNSVHLTEI